MGKKISSTGPFIARLAVIIITVLSGILIYLEASNSFSFLLLVIIAIYLYLFSHVLVDLYFDKWVVFEEDSFRFRRLFRSPAKVSLPDVISIDWSPYVYGLAGWSGRRSYTISYRDDANRKRKLSFYVPASRRKEFDKIIEAILSTNEATEPSRIVLTS